MDLSNLRPGDPKHSDNFRRGRGHGSGNGKTASKGHKGQKGSFRPGPGLRAVRCRCIEELKRIQVQEIQGDRGINLSALERFEDGATMTVETLMEAGVVKNPRAA